MRPPAFADPTSLRYRLVLAITTLTVAHHVDHVLRGVTGWPLAAELNAFTISLLVYPAIAMGLALTRRRRAGPRFWMILAGGGALFILIVHVGPAAGDSVTTIPDQYASFLADVAALIVLAALLVSLVVHAAYEARRLRETVPTATPETEAFRRDAARAREQSRPSSPGDRS